jgi:hypothetical protein
MTFYEKREKLLNLFLSSNLKIKSIECLNEYVDFCLLYNNIDKIKRKTATHHILPKANNLPFTEFKNLKENIWNSSELYHSDHLYAHWLLFKAIEHISISSAFLAMHNKSPKHNCFDIEVINFESFQNIMETAYLERTKYMNELILFNNEYITRYKLNGIKANETMSEKDKMIKTQRMLETRNKNNSYISGTQKMLETRKENNSYETVGPTMSRALLKDIILENGETSTVAKECAKKMIKTRKTEFINEVGEVTSILKESAKKTKETRSKSILYNGEIVNEYILTNRENARKRSEQYGRFNVYNINQEQPIYENLTLKEVKDISQHLPSKSKEDYLGRYQSVATNYIKNKKAYMIGLYVIKKDNND